MKYDVLHFVRDMGFIDIVCWTAFLVGFGYALAPGYKVGADCATPNYSTGEADPVVARFLGVITAPLAGFVVGCCAMWPAAVVGFVWWRFIG